MTRKKMRQYMMAVLTYYRAEWTDVSDEDDQYRLIVTKQLKSVIANCLRNRMSVPNAAKEVEIFLGLQDGCPMCDAPEKDRKAKNDTEGSVADDELEFGGSPGEDPAQGV